MGEEGEGVAGRDTGPGGGPWRPTPSLGLANYEVQGDLESMPFKSTLRPLGQPFSPRTVPEAGNCVLARARPAWWSQGGARARKAGGGEGVGG